MGMRTVLPNLCRINRLIYTDMMVPSYICIPTNMTIG